MFHKKVSFFENQSDKMDRDLRYGEMVSDNSYLPAGKQIIVV